MKIQYDFFYIFERIGRTHENKTFYYFILKTCFDKNQVILIPDLYLYNIKIQTNIDQNTVKKFQKITDF